MRRPSDWLKEADVIADRIIEVKLKRLRALETGFPFLVKAYDDLIAALDSNEMQALRFAAGDL
jgi:hypothetical protein